MTREELLARLDAFIDELRPDAERETGSVVHNAYAALLVVRSALASGRDESLSFHMEALSRTVMTVEERRIGERRIEERRRENRPEYEPGGTLVDRRHFDRRYEALRLLED